MQVTDALRRSMTASPSKKARSGQSDNARQGPIAARPAVNFRPLRFRQVGCSGEEKASAAAGVGRRPVAVTGMHRLAAQADRFGRRAASIRSGRADRLAIPPSVLEAR